MALSIISLNINGLRDVDKRRGVMQWLNSLPSPGDVLCLQETHYLSEAESRVGTPYNGLYGEAPPERGTFFRLQV